MPSYTITGTIKHIFEPQTFARGFTKRDFVLTTEDDRPQDIKLECVAEWCGLLDNVRPQERVTVNFRLRGNEYKDRFFVNLQAYAIDKLEGDGSSTSIEPALPDTEEDAFEVEPF